MTTVIQSPIRKSGWASRHQEQKSKASLKSWSTFGILAITPFALFLIIFGIYPIVQLIIMSVSKVQITQGGFQFIFNGFDNFIKILNNPDTWPVFLVTIIFILGAVLLTVIFGTLLAVMLDHAKFMRGVAKRILIWPTVIAPVVVSVVWLLLLSPTVGGLNKLLIALGLPEQGMLGEPVGAMLSIILVDVWHWTPLVFLLVYTALQSLDTEVLEAARVDGASESQAIWRVVLPIIKPAIITATMIRTVMSVKAFDEMFLLTHGGPGNSTNLISLHIRTIFFDRLEFGYGAALGTTVILVFAILSSFFFLIKKIIRIRVSASE